MNAADTIRELMTRYNEARAAWIQQYGTDAGFDAWFTKQVTEGQNCECSCGGKNHGAGA